MVGRLDRNGNFTGRDLVYMYPDHETALLGTWVRGRMVSSTPAMITAVTREENMMRLELRKISTSCYSYDPASRHVISRQPLLSDPYETRLVTVSACKASAKKNVLTKPSVENNQFTRKEVEKIDIMKQKENQRTEKEEKEEDT